MVVKNLKSIDQDGHISIITEDKKIKEVTKNCDFNDAIDGNGLLALPALFDLNLRVRNDSLTHDRLKMMSVDAKEGGVGAGLLMPDSVPPIDNEAVIELINTDVKEREIELYPVCLGVKENNKLTDISILIKKGCVGIYAPSSLNGGLLRRIFEYAKLWDVPLFCHCEDVSLASNGVMNEGHYSAKYGLPGIPEIAETKEVAKLCEIAIDTGAKVVFQSLGSARSVEIIKKAKEQGANVFAEVSIHHLSLTEKACEGFDTSAKIKPPLGSNQTRLKLLEALKNGDIDFLTSLHSPKSITKKDLAFEEASFGIDAVNDYFPLLYTNLVRNCTIGLDRVLECACKNQAKLLNQQNRGELKEGFGADFIVVDTESSKCIETPYSPYKRSELFGQVKLVVINGEIKLNRL